MNRCSCSPACWHPCRPPAPWRPCRILLPSLQNNGVLGGRRLSAPRSTLSLALSLPLTRSAGVGAQPGPRSLPVSISERAEEAPEPRSSSSSWPEPCLPAKTWFLKGRLTKSHFKGQEGGCAARHHREAWLGRDGFGVFAPREDEPRRGFSRWWRKGWTELQRRSRRPAIPLWESGPAGVNGRRLLAFGPVKSLFP